MTGLFCCCADTTARQIVSEATTEPPGLSTRNRIARTRRSRAASRKARAMSSAAISPAPDSGLAEPSPRTISPVP